MTGFATDYLKDYEGADDWVCIIDFCGRDQAIGDIANVSAWYSKSRQIVAFGNMWHGVPNMPCKRTPTESRCNKWIDNNHDHCNYERKRRAAIARDERRQQESDKLYAWYDKHGRNYAFAAYKLADGSIKSVVQCIGIRTLFDVLPCMMANDDCKQIVRLRVGKETEMNQAHTAWKLAQDMVA